MHHFFIQKSSKIYFKSIFLKACSKKASKMHQIGHMIPPRGSQDASRTAQDGFCFHFGAPTWGQVGAMLATVPAQDASMTPPRRSQERPKIQYNLGSRPKPGYPISPGDLGSIFDRFLVHFWTIFGGFLVPFLIDFYPKRSRAANPPPRLRIHFFYILLL